LLKRLFLAVFSTHLLWYARVVVGEVVGAFWR